MVILLQSVSCSGNPQAGFTSADVGALDLQSFRIVVIRITIDGLSGEHLAQSDRERVISLISGTRPRGPPLHPNALRILKATKKFSTESVRPPEKNFLRASGRQPSCDLRFSCFPYLPQPKSQIPLTFLLPSNFSLQISQPPPPTRTV